jgi:hypothetical protein
MLGRLAQALSRARSLPQAAGVIVCSTRRLLVAVAVTCALVTTTGATATELTIYPGLGIGKVTLGMTRTNVVKALGRDYIVNGRAGPYVELLWNFGAWVVELLQVGQRYQTVEVSTALRLQKTASGLGPGTPWLKLVHKSPGGRCALGDSVGLPSPTASRINYLEYLMGHKGGTQTVYVLYPDYNKKTHLLTTYFVGEVHIRTTFDRLPEFAPDSPYRCADGWKDMAKPEPYG